MLTYWPVDLDLRVFPTFAKFLPNFNIGHNFWMVAVSAFILYMYIPCNKTFSTVPTIWTSSLTYFFKVLSLDITTRVFIFHMFIPCDKSGTRPFMESTFQHMTMFSSNPFSNQLNESQSMAVYYVYTIQQRHVVLIGLLRNVNLVIGKNSTASLLVFYKA